MDPDERALAWAAANHSLITRAAARRAGLSDKQIRHRLRSKRWVLVRPGVFLVGGVPVTPMHDLAAATLHLDAVASHRSSVWLLLLEEDPPRLPELTAALGSGHHATGVRLHRTHDLLRRDTQTIQGIRCTNAIRTCIDMGARLDADDLERLIDRAILRRLVHPTPLIARFLQLARPGRDGTATARTVLTRIDPTLEPAESDLETLLMQVLRDNGIELPVRQHPVTIDGRDFRIDVAYPELRIAIESDGFSDHGSRQAFENDRERQNLLALEGWTILRFTWRQICGRPEWVAVQVATALDRAARAA